MEAHEMTAEQRATLSAAVAAVSPAPEQLQRLRMLAKAAYTPLPEQARAALEQRRTAS